MKAVFSGPVANLTAQNGVPPLGLVLRLGRCTVPVERVRDRRAEPRESTKAEILEAAWAIVRADGLAALSLRDLARQVGMQAPTALSVWRWSCSSGNQRLAGEQIVLRRPAEPPPATPLGQHPLTWLERTVS